MRKSTRALGGMVVLDLLLLGGFTWLVLQIRLGHARTTVPPEEAIATITSIGGGGIGVVTAVLGIAWFVHRRNGN